RRVSRHGTFWGGCASPSAPPARPGVSWGVSRELSQQDLEGLVAALDSAVRRDLGRESALVRLGPVLNLGAAEVESHTLTAQVAGAIEAHSKCVALRPAPDEGGGGD